MIVNLLIVDDDDDFRELLQEGLKVIKDSSGINCLCDTANSVKEAKKKLLKKKYKIIISDIMMPNDDGFELFRHLNEINFDGKFIVMTGMHDEKIAKRALDMGASDILYKPFSFQSLVKKISSYLQEATSSMEGNLRNVDISTIIQLLHFEKKTITLNVTIDDQKGKLFFEKGELIHSTYKDLEGEKACKLILNKQRVMFSFTEEKSKKHTIDTPLMHLLLSISKEADEKQKTPNNNKKRYVEILNEAMNKFKENLGNGLISSDIVNLKDGKAIVSATEVDNKKTVTLSILLVKKMVEIIKRSGLPAMGKRIMINLEGDKTLLIMIEGNIIWGSVLDAKKYQLGPLVNILIPQAREDLVQAIK